MKDTISKSMFIERFRKIRPDNFTYEGLNALYDYLSKQELEAGYEIECDVIGLCLEFEEGQIEYFLSQYGVEDIRELEKNTTIIKVPGIENQIIIQVF